MSVGAIQLKTTKTKCLTPCIGDLALHSLIDPVREAEVLASNYFSHLSKNSRVLVLGLGFAYHIFEIEKVLSLKHEDYQITVIESNKRLVEVFRKYHPDFKHHIYTDNEPLHLFHQYELASFLIQKPSLVLHPQSYKSNSSFYRDFLSRRSTSSFKVNPAKASLYSFFQECIS